MISDSNKKMGFGLFLVKVDQNSIQNFEGLTLVDRVHTLNSTQHKTKFLTSFTYLCMDNIINTLKGSQISEFQNIDSYIDSDGTLLNLNECKILKQGIIKVLEGKSLIPILLEIAIYLGMIYQDLNLVKKDSYFLLIQ